MLFFQYIYYKISRLLSRSILVLSNYTSKIVQIVWRVGLVIFAEKIQLHSLNSIHLLGSVVSIQWDISANPSNRLSR